MRKNLHNDSLLSRDGVSYLIPFVLVTSCFALWGFANDITNPMVKAFSKIFRMSVTDGALVQVAFYGGYFAMAFPAAMFIRRYSYKAGVLMGLGLYAVGALLFLPASLTGMYYPFLVAYFILTCGLSFLETSCNPYIYSMGSERHSVQRLNAVQSFNALGTLAGVLVAVAVHKQVSPVPTQARLHLPLAQFNILKDHDLGVLIQPYIYIGAIVLILLVVLAITRMPNDSDKGRDKNISDILRQLWHRRNYREGTITLFCYTGAQVACWSYIMQYGMRLFTSQGMDEQQAMLETQKYNIAAMVLFAVFRFLSTWLMNWFNPSRMLTIAGVFGIGTVMGSILFTDMNGMYCLVAASACLSLMFPTIYGLSLTGCGDNVKIAGAGLIMAILGGSFFAPIQAAVIDSQLTIAGLPSTNLSFLIPLFCLAVVTWYGHRTYVRFSLRNDDHTA